MKYKNSIKTLTLIFCLLFAQLGQAFALASFKSNNQHCDMQMQANSDSTPGATVDDHNTEQSATMDCCDDQATNCCSMSECQCSHFTTSIADVSRAELLRFDVLTSQHIELAEYHITSSYFSLPKRPPIFIYS